MISSLLKNPTVAISAGTSTSLSAVPSNGKSVVLKEIAEASVNKREVVLTPLYGQSNPDALGGVTMDRSKVKYTVPFTRADGLVRRNYIQFELAVDPEITSAEKRILIEEFVSILSDSSLDVFLMMGGTS